MASEINYKTPTEYKDFSIKLKAIVEGKKEAPAELPRYINMFTKLEAEGTDLIRTYEVFLGIDGHEDPNEEAISKEFFANIEVIRKKLNSWKSPLEKFCDSCGKMAAELNENTKSNGQWTEENLQNYQKLHEDLMEMGNNRLRKLNPQDPLIQRAAQEFSRNIGEVSVVLRENLNIMVDMKIGDFSRLAHNLKEELRTTPEMHSEKLEKFTKLHRDLNSQGNQRLQDVAKLAPRHPIVIATTRDFSITMRDISISLSKLQKPVDLNTRAHFLSEGLRSVDAPLDEKTWKGTMASVTALFYEGKEMYADKNDAALCALSKDFSHTMDNVVSQLEFIRDSMPNKKAGSSGLLSQFAGFVRNYFPTPELAEEEDKEEVEEPGEIFAMKTLEADFSGRPSPVLSDKELDMVYSSDSDGI